MSISERYLSYAVPPVISSSEFTTEFITYQPSGSQRDFSQGDSFTISLANLNKAQYLLPDSCTLAFDVTVGATASNTGPAGVGLAEDIGVMHTVDTVPRPYFGCPFFDSATCAVPGSASFDALPSSAEETAQYFYSTRLLASSVSGEGSFDRGATFRLSGRYNFAGGKSGYERAACITGSRKTFAADNTTALTRSLRGGSLSYAVPLSAFCTLFSKSSSLIPVGMLSSGGEALVFQFTVARDIASVLGSLVGTGFATASFKILNPRILASVVRVQNPVTVAQLSALYDARVKALLPGPTPESPPTSISMPMVVSHKRFVFARTVIPQSSASSTLYSSSTMGLTFSGVNEPSVSAIVLRFRYRPGASGVPDGAAARQAAIRYLGGEEPDIVVRDLQARINDQLIPLRGLSDEGASDTPVFKADGTAADPANGPTLVAQTAASIASTLFDLGRPGLGMWMEDDHGSSLSDVVFDRSSVFGKYNQVASQGGTANGGFNVTMRNAGDAVTTNLIDGAGSKPVTCRKTPMALFIIPLVSLPQLVGDYANAHTLRSWDLRSVSTFSVTATIQVKVDSANGIAGAQTGEQVNSFIGAPSADIICDGALVCDGMLRLAAGSSDSRYVYTAVANATVAGM